MEFTKYQNSAEYSYAFGAFVTIELINTRPQDTLCVLVHSSFTSNIAYTKMLRLCKDHKIQTIVNSEAVEGLRDKDNVYVIGVFTKHNYPLSNKNHIMLVNPTDLGSLGTIMRTMTGFDFHDLVIIGNQIDVYDPRIVRSSMGAIFYINIEQYKTIAEYKEKHNHRVLYVTSEGDRVLTDLKYEENICVALSESTPLGPNDYAEKVLFKKAINSENIVNIILYTLYVSK